MATKIKDLKNNIKKILNQKARQEIFQISGDIAEAIGSITNGPNKSIRDQRADYIFNTLGHISLNTSDKETTLALTETYEYIDSNSQANTEIPNINPSSTELFIKELITAAKTEAARRKETDELYHNMERQVYVLHGPRGCGKTFFINHALSKNGDLLDSEKCIYVRVDLTDRFGGISPNVAHWLLSKLVLVIFRYYNSDSKIPEEKISDEKHIEIKKTLVEYIRNKEPKETMDLLFLKLSDMERIFMEEKVVALTSDIVPFEFGIEISKILVDRGYSFIYIIDGLDRLDITPKYEEKFDNVISSLNSNLGSDTSLGGVFLLVMRDESMEQVMSRLGRVHPGGRNLDYIVKECRVPSFKKILENRIKYIQKRMEVIGPLKGWDMSDWSGHIEGYAKYLLSENNDEDTTQYTSRLDTIFSNNQRAKVQLMQCCYDDYLRTMKHKKEYTIIERMCRGGYKYPIAPNYSVDQHGSIIHSFEKKYDNVFLPNIFHFPYSRNYRLQNNGHAITHILAGLRIMQLVCAISSYNLKMKNRTVSYCEELIDLMFRVFEYDKIILANIVLLFSEYEMISLDGGPITSNEINHHVFMPMPKITYILNNLMGNVAYLNMSAMRAPINKTFIIDHPMLFACCFEDVNRDEWMAKKTMNAVNFFKIIATVNQLESEGVKKVIKKIDNPEYRAIIKYAEDNYNIFNFLDKEIGNRTPKAAILGQIDGILDTIHDLSYIENLINKTWDV